MLKRMGHSFPNSKKRNVIVTYIMERKVTMFIRKYQSGDCRELAELFYNTVHSVNCRDYTKEQLDAWAPGSVDMDAWNQSFEEHFTLIAEEEDRIIGFGDMSADGYLDRLYVHRDYQGKGAASALCGRMEQWIRGQGSAEGGLVATTHASITARPFFEKRGYHVVKEQQVERRGQILTNYVMDKRL